MINAWGRELIWRTIGIVMLSVLLGTRHPVFAKSTACTRAQLEMRQIALDSPGMSQSNAFFAILNTGKRPCRLFTRYASVSEKPNLANFFDNAEASFLLLPLRNGRYAGARNVVGLNVSNDGASGPIRNIHTLIFQLAHGMTFLAAYDGYDTSPFSRLEKLIRLSEWQVFKSDQCIMAENKPLSFIDNPEIDTKQRLLCG